MSALRPSPTTPGTFLCPRCGNTLRDDQAWCLECGLAARTRIHPPPSWRVPIAVTALVLVLLAAAIAYALWALLDKPQSTPPPATVTVPAATAPATTTPPAATVPTTTTPTTPTAPTVPTGTTTAPAIPPTTTTPSTPTTPSGGATRSFTIPGTRTRIRLPATAK